MELRGTSRPRPFLRGRRLRIFHIIAKGCFIDHPQFTNQCWEWICCETFRFRLWRIRDLKLALLAGEWRWTFTVTSQNGECPPATGTGVHNPTCRPSIRSSCFFWVTEPHPVSHHRRGCRMGCRDQNCDGTE